MLDPLLPHIPWFYLPWKTLVSCLLSECSRTQASQVICSSSFPVWKYTQYRGCLHFLFLLLLLLLLRPILNSWHINIPLLIRIRLIKTHTRRILKAKLFLLPKSTSTYRRVPSYYLKLLLEPVDVVALAAFSWRTDIRQRFNTWSTQAPLPLHEICSGDFLITGSILTFT
ncbi:hypothetical protein M7I_6226 [Glarea lozoyensis 74030]|uniref:Uncharacterized protein n=1 Tax=Glarea lozoyensis (strain ATCC 74030 / MF5533) TaxID=1104152 RepID=H0EU01_GLAL7|nr:hypothetical protein M7I_6226 [Glarea lozoyensis 74030]